LMPYIHQYMDVWYGGLPFLIIPIVLNGLVRATGDSFFPSILMVVAAGVNAVLSPVLVFGHLGAPALGMAGAAWATIAARGLVTLFYFAYLARLKLFAFSLTALSHFNECVRDVMRYGAPAIAAQLVSPVAGAIITRLLSNQGPEAVAAFAIGARIEALALVPFFALQTGVGPFIGQNVGAGNKERLRLAERSVLLFCFGWGALAAIILVGWGGTLSSFFTQDAHINALSDQYLAFIALGLWGAGLLIAGVGIFNPLGYPNLGMALSALRYIALYTGGAIMVSFIMSGQGAVYGIYLSAPLSNVLAGGAALIFVHRLLDKPRELAKRNRAAPRRIVGHDDMRPTRHPTDSFKGQTTKRKGLSPSPMGPNEEDHGPTEAP
ncbi:MAG: MATE family efflux transporter, partial [Pseudomonadota bacterium]